jgi:hypothetical protein
MEMKLKIELTFTLRVEKKITQIDFFFSLFRKKVTGSNSVFDCQHSHKNWMDFDPIPDVFWQV